MKLKELKCGSKFKYKGYEFTKLADEKNSCYCLLNDTVFESKFGKTNGWAKSLIRKRLNEFDEDGASKVISGINKDDLVQVSLNYYAYGIPNGRTTDRITCLSWEEWYAYYYAKDFDIAGYSSWLRSGNNGGTNAYYQYRALYLDYSSGGAGSTYTNFGYAVRPALHFKADIEVEGTR